jgi:diacylglycerol kinase (ATP)
VTTTRRDTHRADPDDASAPLIVVNPRAARLADPRRRGEVIEAIARAVLARTGRPARVVDGDQAAAHAAITRLIGTPEPPLVVVAGGDGTIRDAAAALAGRRVRLAIVPGGTGNVLASALGLGSVRAAVDAIRHGRERSIDLGSARWGPLKPDSASPDRGGVFVVACGMGLDARIMAAAQHEWKRRMRFGAYVGAAIGELARLSTAVFQITADGNELEMRGYLVLVANTGDIIPGRVGPRRPLDPSDGRLELIVLGADHPLDGLRSAAALLLSRDELDGRVIRRSVSEVRVVAEPVQPIQVDGDHEPAGWLEANVIPGALTVLGPPAQAVPARA